MRAYSKDIFKTIVKEKKRFFSLMIISALGVLMTTGIKAGCDDTRSSADKYYKKQHLRDFYIQSTLGLTEDDVEALLKEDEICEADGFFEETDYYISDGIKYSLMMSSFSDKVDIPYVREGTLPDSDDEIAITSDFSNKFKIYPGDSVKIQKSEDSFLINSSYIVSAIVNNSADVNNTEGCTSFRSTSVNDYTVFLNKSAFDTDIYSSVGFNLKDSKKYNTYSNEYSSLILDFSGKLETIKEKRETARTQSIIYDALDEIDKKRNEMNEEFEKAEKELNDADLSLMQAKEELENGQKMIDAGIVTDETIITQIRTGWDSYYEGLNEYEENKNKFYDEKKDALKKIEDAEDEVYDIESAKWYIFTRNNLSGFSNISSDMDAIDSLSLIFTLGFLIVAVLVASITINRMIEENRGLIGTYQALGFTDREVIRKYLVFGAGASAAGCLIGDALGYIALPEFLFIFFNKMYILPHISLSVDLMQAVAAPLIFISGIVITIIFTCLKAFRTMPAELMRPKAPKPGSKVFLERISFVWKQLSFLNKVTARNIFRYKKRLLMTVIGIMGCTALLVCGFGIKDSVDHLMVCQYDNIIHYDLLTSLSEDDLSDYEKDINIKKSEYLPFVMQSVTLKNTSDKTIQTQLYVFDDSKKAENFISIVGFENGKKITFDNDKVYITKNASVVLELSEGDKVNLLDGNFIQSDMEIGCISENYLGNMVFMNKNTYEKNFRKYEPNAVLINTDCVSELAENDLVRTSVITHELKEDFSDSFSLINSVVYLLIGLSAALAFVVLYTLSSTNISERERELATIKVLGFYDSEVHMYINTEIIILTLIAIVLGLPVGSFLCGLLTGALKMPSLYFKVFIKPVSFVFSFLITFIFALLVNVFMHRTLDDIEPAEALKSIE